MFLVNVLPKAFCRRRNIKDNKRVLLLSKLYFFFFVSYVLSLKYALTSNIGIQNSTL